MINLITGVPGSGKTVYSLVFMLEAYNDGRPIYVHGIPDLKIEHTQVICSSPSCSVCPPAPVEPLEPDLPENASISDPVTKAINRNRHKNYLSQLKSYLFKKSEFDKSLKAEEWQKWAPDGAFIFYDEVQNVYRPRSSSKAVPESVAAFETHRHKGLDFFLVSQSPLLFDGNIRRLVNKHIHLRPTWAGRYQYEFPECNDSPKNTTQGIKSKYTLDKKVFSLFKSASLHTKQSKKIPLSFYLIFICFFVLILLLVRMNTRFSDMQQPEVLPEAIEKTVIDNNELKEDKKRFGLTMLSQWVRHGVPTSEFDYLPDTCEINKTTVKCPPFTIKPYLLKSTKANRVCSGQGKCYSFFPLQIASSE